MRYITKIDNNYEFVLEESIVPTGALPRFIIIAGVVWLFLKWRDRSERLMRSMNVNYGDSVTSKTKNNYGVINIYNGVVYKKDGVPWVKLHSFVNGKNNIPWDTTFLKS